MPKRMISDAIWKSKKIRQVQPPDYRVEYAWIIAHFEDNGVCEYDPESLWADAYATARPGWTNVLNCAEINQEKDCRQSMQSELVI
jgi:hypothetical protein